MDTQETICAVSTPPGVGGIAVVRLSGSQSLVIAEKIFRKKSPVPLTKLPSHTVHYGTIVRPETGEILDEVLLMVLRGPRTYTREDMVEIQCHGGHLPIHRILEAILREGGRLAGPGEFTKRAFLNGRIDLAQAEAVMDLIGSTSEREMSVALRHLQGGLSREIQDIQESIVSVLAPLEALLDFPEEEIALDRREGEGDSHSIQEDGIPLVSSVPQTAVETIRTLHERVGHLIRSYDQGKVLKEGIKTAIVGRPNVGKSTLLNRLLGEDRAIVTAFPGTTRDVLEERILLDGVPLRILDMAGIRETHDPVEQEGIHRARKALQDADLILLVLDGGEPLTQEDCDLIEATRNRNRIIILNKCDKDRKFDDADFGNDRLFRVSALDGTGLEALQKGIPAYIREAIWNDQGIEESPWVLRLRHQEALKRGEGHLSGFLKAAASHVPLDILSVHLRGAVDALGEIVGTVTAEDILDRIFSEFCIGK
ncbi:MAG: tRNA uridine-5-carboxymethylaminomethyl(34) synthesis GTPase MnmE [Nitrospirae bacterium]|nr:tRNA uridine-5-carboxymethylaminomethyl(34) synthesis GTPase MnmE [Nitrospirota bacterium]